MLKLFPSLIRLLTNRHNEGIHFISSRIKVSHRGILGDLRSNSNSIFLTQKYLSGIKSKPLQTPTMLNVYFIMILIFVVYSEWSLEQMCAKMIFLHLEI